MFYKKNEFPRNFLGNMPPSLKASKYSTCKTLHKKRKNGTAKTRSIYRETRRSWFATALNSTKIHRQRIKSRIRPRKRKYFSLMHETRAIKLRCFLAELLSTGLKSVTPTFPPLSSLSSASWLQLQIYSQESACEGERKLI